MLFELIIYKDCSLFQAVHSLIYFETYLPNLIFNFMQLILVHDDLRNFTKCIFIFSAFFIVDDKKKCFTSAVRNFAPDVLIALFKIGFSSRRLAAGAAVSLSYVSL